ncbi:Zn(2)-Cys(6) binuclear cluster domain-containing protein [Mycena vitilis]|nr:Zn(2)-Cys(6) binuclear cluster domain-containing protein [Mycena vitilis]
MHSLLSVMAKEGSNSHLSESSTTKAKACINCRRRKIKCDGVRPKCGPCSRSMGFQDCEYAEDGLTRTQILEDQIAILEARIEELEKPQELRSTLVLNNPYAEQLGPGLSPATPRRGPSLRLPIASQGSSGLSSPLSLPTSPVSGLASVELEALVLNFLKHGSQFGFFLHVNNFREAAMGLGSERPTPVLLDVVNLWAIHLSGSNEFLMYEATYLWRALSTTVDALSGAHGHNTILHTIQAEVLLAHYFLRNTRFLEAKYHVSAAVSLVLSAGLHRLRSADLHTIGGPLGPAFHALPAPRNATEENERICAFWTVLTLNNCWTTADGSPSNISYTVPDARIDTPWPLDINASDLQTQVLPDSTVGTVTTFLANLPDAGISESALHAKAAVLFEQASRLASQYRPDISREQLNQFYASFNFIDALIEGFKISLPAVHAHSTREMLVLNCLVQVSTIQLHNPFVGEIDASRRRVLDSARAIVADLQQVPVNDFLFIDPIMGTLLMATCQVFIAELGRFRRQRSSNPAVATHEKALKDAIDTVLTVMNVFAPRCRLMESQLVAVQQLYHGL